MIFDDLEQLNSHLEKEGRIIGLDVGTKTIGVALSDASQTIATPKLTIKRKSNQKDFAALEALVKEYNIKTVIIGLPLNMDGSISKISEFVKNFAVNFNQFLNDIKISFCDERLTSFIAEDTIYQIKAKDSKRKKLVDQIAAALILQSALDYLQNIKKYDKSP